MSIHYEPADLNLRERVLTENLIAYNYSDLFYVFQFVSDPSLSREERDDLQEWCESNLDHQVDTFAVSPMFSFVSIYDEQTAMLFRLRFS